MKVIATLMGVLAPATGFAASTVLAGSDEIFIWIFLGFFAMIVVGELIPAFMLVTGLIKRIAGGTGMTG